MSSQPALLYPAATGAEPIVYDAYDKWSGIAQQAFATAQLLASEIANLPVSSVNFNANFSPQLALSGFPTLAAPNAPGDLTLTPPPDPGTPPVITVPVVPPLQYVSDLASTIRSTLMTLLGGNPLPASVAQAMRNRAYSEAYAEEQRAISQAFDEYASRGFEEPNGLLNKRVTEARADARNKRQQINRDVYIQEQTIAIENLRFAVTSAIQAEGQNIELYRAQSQLEISNMQVAIEQNRLVLDGWRAQVELYDTRLKAEIAIVDTALREFDAQVEVYKASAQVATAAGAYDERRFQLNVAQQQAIVDTEMKRQDQLFEQMKYITSVMLQVKQALADVGARLASAAMSAVNIGATVSSQTSEAVDYSLRVDYYGQMDSTS
ncbi:hypothetical protein [Dyella sp.]|uniref:hypothetical protein n=1 Tax=Dyella sp. TaxID=1869338 RepID=UPI002FDAF8AB